MIRHSTEAGRLGPWSLFSLIFCITVGYGLLLGPTMVIRVAREASPLMMLLGVLAAAGMTVIAVWLANQFPQQTIVQWSIGMFGPFGYAWSIGLMLYVLVFVAFQNYQFSILLHMLFLDRTPVVALVITGALVMAYGASLGIDVISRFFRLVMFLEFTILPLLLVLGIKEVEIPFLLPLTPTAPPVWLQGPFYGLAALMGFLYPPLMLRPSVDNRQQVLWPCVIGVLAAGVFMVGATVGILGTFGADANEHLVFSVFDFMEVATLPRAIEFITRYAPYFAIVWELAVLKVGMLSLHVAATGVEQLLGVQRRRRWTPLVAATGLLAAGFIPNAHVGQRLLEFTALAGVPMAMVNTFVFALLVLLMRRRARRVANEAGSS